MVNKNFKQGEDSPCFFYLSIFCYDVGAIKQSVKNVMIIGGGKIAFYLVKQ